MPRKYSVEFKEKAVHQIIEMVRLESCSLFEQPAKAKALTATADKTNLRVFIKNPSISRS